jgi:uncharacterized protein involved in exopolysaccharide biosynthesis
MDYVHIGLNIGLPTVLAPPRRAGPPDAMPRELIYDPALASAAAGGPRRRGMPVPGGSFRQAAVPWIKAMVVGAAVGCAVALVRPAEYSATAVVIGPADSGGPVQDQLAVAQSDGVVEGVVDRVGAGRILEGLGAPLMRFWPACPAGETAADCAAAATRRGLQVTAPGDAAGSMLRITATHPSAAVAAAMVEAAAVVDRTLWRNARVIDRAAALVPQLTEARNEIASARAEAAQIRADAGVTDLAQQMAAAIADVVDLARQKFKVQVRRSELDAELAVDRAALQAMPAMVLDSREVGSGDAARDTRALLLQLRLDRAHMAQLYAADYPGIAELDRKIATVESALKQQSLNTTPVTRDVRNPALGPLSAKVTALEAEAAGLVRQTAELARQAAPVEARADALRDAATRLAALQEQQGVEEAVVRQLSLQMASLQTEDTLMAARLDQRHLLQHPVATLVPWTGLQGGLAAGAMTAVLCGIAGSLAGRRRGRVPERPDEDRVDELADTAPLQRVGAPVAALVEAAPVELPADPPLPDGAADDAAFVPAVAPATYDTAASETGSGRLLTELLATGALGIRSFAQPVAAEAVGAAPPPCPVRRSLFSAYARVTADAPSRV